MQKALLNIKLDPATKREIQEFAAELGVPVSVLMNAQIKQLLRDRKVTLSAELEPTPYLEKVMRQVDADVESGKNVTRTSTAAAALAHLSRL
jgi:antitoxin component of RelBE/YafQ-DinJ toxin-antitoxin module